MIIIVITATAAKCNCVGRLHPVFLFINLITLDNKWAEVAPRCKMLVHWLSLFINLRTIVLDNKGMETRGETLCQNNLVRKKDRRGQKTRRSHSVRGIQCQRIQGRWGSKYKTGVRTIECQKKSQRESKSKRIGIHTCFQASIETLDFDDVALPNYQIQS